MKFNKCTAGDSPWRENTEKEQIIQCPESNQSESGTNAGSSQSGEEKEGDTVETKTKLGELQGKLTKSPFGTMVSNCYQY